MPDLKRDHLHQYLINNEEEIVVFSFWKSE